MGGVSSAAETRIRVLAGCRIVADEIAAARAFARRLERDVAGAIREPANRRVLGLEFATAEDALNGQLGGIALLLGK